MISKKVVATVGSATLLAAMAIHSGVVMAQEGQLRGNIRVVIHNDLVLFNPAPVT